MEKYYKCRVKSKLGSDLDKLLKKINKASKAADEYAKSMGASSYYQPVQFLEGGVDYLMFDSEPNPKIWRKKVIGDAVVYEPECLVKSGCKILSYGMPLPKDYERRMYLYNKAKQIDDRKTELPYIDFCPSDKNDKTASRKAISAERKRLRLPVVKVEEFYCLMDLKMPTSKKAQKEIARNAVTPVFFKWEDEYYIKVVGECGAEGLEEIEAEIFNLALAQVKTTEDRSS